MPDIFSAILRQNARALKKKYKKKKNGVCRKNKNIIAKNNRLKEPNYISRNI